MGERLQGAASPFSFPNVILVLWCLSSMIVGRSHKRPPFCDKDQPESKREPKSFLWAIKREPPSYFFGTIHVPYTRVWDYIPENTKRAFELAEHVFFELDLTDPYTISALTNCQLLPNGKNLSDVLPRDIYQRLKHHLEYIKLMIPNWLTDDQRGQGLYAEYLFNALTGNWERKRPVWVMLMVNSLTESDIKSRGIPVLDLYLAQEADKMNKVTGAVEKVEEQCVPLNGLNLSQILFALNQTLIQHESLRAGALRLQYTTDDLIKHYNCGDLNTVIFNQDTTQIPSLVNSTLPPLDILTAQKIDEYFRNELICRRNKRMGERVTELLLAHPDKSFFFAFGAGHFIGNHTVLDVVQSMGYEVEHISIYHKVKHHRHRHKERERTPTLPEFSLLQDFSMPNALDQQNDEDRTVDEDVNVRAVGTVDSARRRIKQRSRKQMASGVDGLSTFSSNKNRNFNDLWVRLDSRPTRISRPYTGLPQEKLTDDAIAIQKSLRVWYGLPNGLSHSSSNKCTIFVAVVASLSALLGWSYNAGTFFCWRIILGR